MFDSFNNDGDWFVVSDDDGRESSMKHLATVVHNGKTYVILGAVKDGPSGAPEGGILLLREEYVSENQKVYSVERDRSIAEHIIGSFIMRTLAEHFAQNMDSCDEPDSQSACGMNHLPGDFCYCDDPQYLQ